MLSAGVGYIVFIIVVKIVENLWISDTIISKIKSK